MTTAQVLAVVAVSAVVSALVAFAVGMLTSRRRPARPVVLVAGAVVMRQPAPATVFDQDEDRTHLQMWANELRDPGGHS